MKKIILITGGERSGKSIYAEQLALSFSPTPVYLATAHIWDEEFRQRVKIHRERRGPQWTNIEEEKHLSRHNLKGQTVLIDCVTLWATNFFFDHRTRPEYPAPDDGETAEYSIPPLTSLRPGFREMGEHAARLLMDRIENRNEFGTPGMFRFPGTLIQRESVARPRKPEGGEQNA